MNPTNSTDAYTASLVMIAQTTHRDMLNRKHHNIDHDQQTRQLAGLLSELEQAEPSLTRALRATLAENERTHAEFNTGCDSCQHCNSDEEELDAVYGAIDAPAEVNA